MLLRGAADHYTHLGGQAQSLASCYTASSSPFERSQVMSQWVETELAKSQMQDARHTKRLAQLLERRSAQPVSSIPRASQGWAETVAAYRFLGNPDVGLAEILSGHQLATLERVQAEGGVLLVQDTTSLNYGTLQPKQGVGTVKEKVREEYLLHLTVAFTPGRMNLGV
jgi:hypothetical protein